MKECLLVAGLLLFTSACVRQSDVVQASDGHALRPFQVLRFPGKHPNGTLSVSTLQGSSRVLSSGGDNTARIWDVATGREIKRFSGSSFQFQNIAMAPAGTAVLTSTPSAAVRFWTVSSGQDIRQFTGAEGSPVAVALSSDGTLAAAAGKGPSIHVWEVATGRPVRELPVKSQVVRIAFAADGADLASAEEDGRLCRWPATGNTKESCFTTGSEPIAQASFTSDASIALVSTRFGTLELWQVNEERSLGKLDHALGDIVSLAISPDGHYALLGGADKTLRLWDLVARHEVSHTIGSGSYISCVAFSQDGSVAVFGSDNGEVALWRLR